MSERRAQTPEAFSALFEPHRFKVFYGGRGGAKSTAFATALLAQAYNEPLRVMCTREIQNSIKDSVHTLLCDRIVAMGLEDFYDRQEAQILGANGSRFFFAGLHRNPDALKSAEGVDRCWIEEADRVSRDSWDKLLPTIRKPGSEIWVSYNPHLKSDPVHQIFHVEGRTGAIVRQVSWRDNPWFTDEMRQEMEDLKRADYPKYRHVWEGEFREYAEGAVYAKQLQQAQEEGRICRVPIQAAEEVNTFWDLGKNDATAIFFHQRVGPDDRFIDYLEFTGQDIDAIAKAVKAKGYNLGTHYMPHDVEHEILGFGNRNRKQMFEAAGIKPIRVVPRIRHLHEGIEMTRARFSSYWFDAERCERGLECLRNYAYERNERRNDLSPEPTHDWSSHACVVAGTRVETTRGTLNIEDVRAGDRVVLLGGAEGTVSAAGRVKVAPVLRIELSDGRAIECTEDHGVFTHRGVLRADALRYNDAVSTRSAPLWSLSQLPSGNIRDGVIAITRACGTGTARGATDAFRRWAGAQWRCIDGFSRTEPAAWWVAARKFTRSMAIGWTSRPRIGDPGGGILSGAWRRSTPFRNSTGSATTCGPMATTASPSMAFCIGWCGSIIGVRFPMDSMFITSTETRRITGSRIWPALLRPSIYRGTANGTDGRWERLGSVILAKWSSLLRRYGMAAMQVGNGIPRTRSRDGGIENDTRSDARIVGMNTSPRSLAGRNFAAHRAVTRIACAVLTEIRNRARALFVGRHSRSIRTGKSARVVRIVRSAQGGRSVPVYDLTVDGHHCYYANGILVSNCDALRQHAQGFRRGSGWGEPTKGMSERRRTLIEGRQSKWVV